MSRRCVRGSERTATAGRPAPLHPLQMPARKIPRKGRMCRQSHQSARHEGRKLLCRNVLEWFILRPHERNLSIRSELEWHAVRPHLLSGWKDCSRRCMHGRLQPHECTGVRTDSKRAECTPGSRRCMPPGSRDSPVPAGRRSLPECSCRVSNALDGRSCRMPCTFAGSRYVIGTSPAGVSDGYDTRCRSAPMTRSLLRRPGKARHGHAG